MKQRFVQGDGTLLHRIPAVLVTGLSPVGLAALTLAKALGTSQLIGIDVIDKRLALARELGLAHHVLKAGPDNVEQILELTSGKGEEKAVDASANDSARLTTIQATRKWGKILFIGEGGVVNFQPSRDMIHDQKTICGSWATSIW